MLRFLKVTEHSLQPAYRDGDFVLISKVPILFGGPRPGDTIVFHRDPYGTLIKLVQRVDLARDEIFVIGLAEESIDSRQFGPIHSKDILGKVIWHISRPDN